jgi:hypothetical protein
MTTLHEAAQQALKSLRGYRREIGCEQPCDAERFVMAALEQPEQEPVAWASKRGLDRIKDFDATVYPKGGFDDAVPLYTHPPRREVEQEAHIKELEQARERDNIAFKQLLAQRDALLEAQNGKKVRNHEGGTRYQPPVEDAAITAIKTALDQPEQEPVAWWIVSKTTDEEFVSVRPNDWSDINWEKHPLYTHPPRREWRGLSEQERHRLWRKLCEGEGLDEYAEAIEAALKERNV